MAKRICFFAAPHQKPAFREELIDFTFYNGFALVQKQKSIQSFHQAIGRIYPEANIIEISTKSTEPLGVALSAFNLKIALSQNSCSYYLENVFQASKVFQGGGPYRDLLDCHPREAKSDERIKNSGPLLYFDFEGEQFPLEPKSLFYDWLYLHALDARPDLTRALIAYDAFTDIEFNHARSINCQARSAAIFVSLLKMGKLPDALRSRQDLERHYLTETPLVMQPLC